MTQCQRILKILEDAHGGWVSTDEIMRQTWITRAPARLLELRKMGHNIEAGGFNEKGFKLYRLLPKETLFY